MLVMQLQGGIGNQIFQYAATKSYSFKKRKRRFCTLANLTYYNQTKFLFKYLSRDY